MCSSSTTKSERVLKFQLPSVVRRTRIDFTTPQHNRALYCGLTTHSRPNKRPAAWSLPGPRLAGNRDLRSPSLDTFLAEGAAAGSPHPSTIWQVHSAVRPPFPENYKGRRTACPLRGANRDHGLGRHRQLSQGHDESEGVGGGFATGAESKRHAWSFRPMGFRRFKPQVIPSYRGF